ncbi:disease resistance protein RPP5 isoform X2 [Raphanus sativus]|nr:disease resistance protein RPP5 isoform X2 [Raphanus sativus]
MIEKVVEKISERRFAEEVRDHPNLVGMRSHMEGLASLLEMESEDEVRIIGISGMEGVGKTTIADYLYRQFSSRFSEHCFIYDVKSICRSTGQSYLEQHFLSEILRIKPKRLARKGAGSHSIKERLRNRKVFAVLDNVDKVEQIHGLAKDKSWFGPGSRVIIITRDKGLLDTCGVEIVYPVKCLSSKDALQMFKQIVFKGTDPPACFEQLLTRVSRLAYGLPSAIIRYSSLCDWHTKTEAEWEKLVSRYEESPHKNIVDILKSSYAELHQVDKLAFLYVACLFNGADIKRVSDLLDDGSESRIQVLVEKSLVDISPQGCINMNTLVENMGRETVVEESDRTPTKQRILWEPRRIYSVLRDESGTRKIEGLALPMCKMPYVLEIERRSFRKMYSVKFLKFHTRNKTSKLQLSPTARLPDMLKLLHWDAYPSRALPSEFLSGFLVELTLRCSRLQFLSKTNLDLRKLKRLDVSESKELKELPDLSGANQLEELVVEGCKSLTFLKDLPQSLNSLNAHGCNSLETVSLPSNHSIKHIDLSDCSPLNNDQELITHFLTQGQHDQETLLRFACIPQTTMPSYLDNCCPRLSPNLMGFSAGIMVACSGPYHLKFSESSYSWNCEEFSINLKPQLYPDLDRVEEEAMNYLVIIQVLSSINNNQPRSFLLELPSRFNSPPVEIRETRVHMFH